jgi:hypothetical protein
VHQPRTPFFIKLRQAAEFHEVQPRAATLIFNQGGNGNDEACGPQRRCFVDQDLINEKAGDESEHN